MKRKIIVVGGGRWGSNHIRSLSQLDSLMGVVEPSESSQIKIRSEFPNVKIYNSIKETFHLNPDGYTVATPPNTHFEIGLEIINNNKPLLIEKPLTLDYNSSKKLVEIANNNNVNLMV